MKFTGLTRRIEIGGRLSLPKGIREHFQTEYIQIYVQKNMIYLSCNVEESKLTKDSLFQVKKIDSVGRLYIPLEIRRSLHLMDYGDEVEIYIDNANQIVLKKRYVFFKSNTENTSFLVNMFQVRKIRNLQKSIKSLDNSLLFDFLTYLMNLEMIRLLHH